MRAVRIRLSILSTVYLFALAFVGGTVRAQQSCSLTLALRLPTAAHIFSSQQERTLGDIEAEWVESKYHADHDEGSRLISTLSQVGFYLDSRAIRRWYTSS